MTMKYVVEDILVMKHEKKIKNRWSIRLFPVHINFVPHYSVTSSAEQRHKHPNQHSYKVIVRILPHF